MNKTVLSLIVLVILAGGAFLVASQLPARDTDGSNLSPLATYFKEQLNTRGVADIGMPIEGFDAGLLLLAYPGFKVEDFQNVETREGYYDVVGGEVTFVRTDTTTITSAERALAPEGYETLLTNVTKRLMLTPRTTGDIDALVERLDTGERVTVMMGATAQAFGVSITPRDVVEDSRCPFGVTCVWEGRVRVRADVVSGMGTSTHVFALNEPFTTEAEELMLVSVDPYPTEGEKLAPADYTFVFSIVKR